MKVKINLPILLLLLVAVFISRDFFFPGFIPTHDGEYHIIRLWQFDKMIKAGELFPRWAPDLNEGLGVPLFQFFYPLPNYIGEFFHLLGFSFVDSIKLVLASGLIISGITFYLWMRSFFKKWPAVVGAIFYLLAPYHLLDVFIRGSVGEVWALALAPLVLFFTTKLIKSPKKERKKFSILNSLSLLPLLTSHNILGVLFFMFCFIYGIVLIIYLKKRVLFRLILSFVLGFLLTSFFFLPAILESKYVTGLEIINYQDHFPSLFQLVIPSWGSGFSVPGVSDKISFQMGIPHILVITASSLLLLFKKEKEVLVFFFLVVSLINLFLILETSLFVWRLFPFMAYFQYPWRLLSLVILISSFFASYAASLKPRFMVPVLIFLSLIFYLPYTKPVVYKARSDSFYLDNPTWTRGTATLGNTFNTIWFQGINKSTKEKAEIVKGEGKIEDLEVMPGKYSFNIETVLRSELRVNTAYFPGWTVWMDGRKASINYHDGLINFSAPYGKHSIIVKFEDTGIRRIANMISLFSGLILFLL